MQVSLPSNPDLLTILIDIDGVVANNRHRLPHICHVVDGKLVDKPEKDWDAYNADEHLDEPTEFLKQVIMWAKTGMYNVVFLTARHESRRASTCEWLNSQGMSPELYHIILRPENDFRKGTHFKREAVALLKELNHKFAFAVDDELENTQMFCKAGIVGLRMLNLVSDNHMHY